MPCLAESVASGAIGASCRVLLVAPEGEELADIAGPLETQGYEVGRIGLSDGLVQTLRRIRPTLMILAPGPGEAARGNASRLSASARELGIPVLVVIEPGLNPEALATHVGDVDDWVFRARASEELPARAARLIRRSEAEAGHGAALPPLDPLFCSLIVHDMRTPLNVVSLSLRLIEQAMPKGDAELDEDLRFVDDNFKQIEQMLTQLSDYSRLFGAEAEGPVVEFSPARLVDELLENWKIRVKAKAKAKVPSVRLEAGPDCPAEASLDQARARMALHYALENASVAANGAPIVFTMRGGPERWVTEIRVDQPPPSSVQSLVLHSRRFERLCGIAPERRGMELAIAARVSELFGGTARLNAVENRSTTLVLDWPARIAEA